MNHLCLRPYVARRLACAALIGLAFASARAADAPAGEDQFCRQRPELHVDGLEPAVNSGLSGIWPGRPEGGGLCEPAVYVATKPVTVYRLSQCTKDRSAHYFNWWSLENPSGSAQAYRAANVMCDVYPVALKTICPLKIGTQIVVGYGQSLTCENGDKLGQSKTVQIFVAGSPAEIKEKMGVCYTEPGLEETRRAGE